MAEDGEDNRRTRGRGGRDRKIPLLAWIGGGAAVIALIILSVLDLGVADHHPAPRPHIDHTHVASYERYAAYPQVARVYADVAAVSQLVDGIYCYCACSVHSGHHSLLDCFHDDHAARCDICLSEGSMAYRMHQDGRSLDEIRTAIDRLYRT